MCAFSSSDLRARNDLLGRGLSLYLQLHPQSVSSAAPSVMKLSLVNLFNVPLRYNTPYGIVCPCTTFYSIKPRSRRSRGSRTTQQVQSNSLSTRIPSPQVPFSSGCCSSLSAPSMRTPLPRTLSRDLQIKTLLTPPPAISLYNHPTPLSAAPSRSNRGSYSHIRPRARARRRPRLAGNVCFGTGDCDGVNKCSHRRGMWALAPGTGRPRQRISTTFKMKPL